MQFLDAFAIFEGVRRYAMFAGIPFVMVFAEASLHHLFNFLQRPVVSQIGVYDGFAEKAAAAAQKEMRAARGRARVHGGEVGIELCAVIGEKVRYGRQNFSASCG